MDAEWNTDPNQSEGSADGSEDLLGGGGFDCVLVQNVDSVVQERLLGLACACCHFHRPSVRRTSSAEFKTVQKSQAMRRPGVHVADTRSSAYNDPGWRSIALRLVPSNGECLDDDFEAVVCTMAGSRRQIITTATSSATADLLHVLKLEA